MIYIFVLLYTIYLIYRYDIRKVKNSNASLSGFKNHYCFLLVVVVSIVGFSYRLGMDTTGYMTYFESVDSDIWYTFIHLLERRYEPIPELLFSFCKSIVDDFALVQIIVAIFVNTTIFWFLKKHSPMFFFSIFLYFIFQFWNLNFEIKRESIAICIFLIALDNLLKDDTNKKDYIKYYIICTIAALAHRFAFITFFYPFLLGLQFSKRYIVFFIVIVLALVLSSSIVSDLFSTFNALIALSSGESIQGYLDSTRFGTGGISFFGTINRIIIPLIIVYSARQGMNKKVYSLTLVYFIVSLLQSQVFIFYRITNYLIFFLFLVYAYSLRLMITSTDSNLSATSKLKTSAKKKVLIILLLFVICFHVITLTKKDEHIRYVPYSSVFTKEISNERESTYEDIDLMLNY